MHVCYDPRTDHLVVTIATTPLVERLAERTLALDLTCILDVGDEGRLLGIEIPVHESCRADTTAPSDVLYLELESSADVRVVRSVSAPARLTCYPESGTAVLVLPRRTDRYELLFPSGAT